VSLALSQASIPEICQKCDHFAAFTGASAKYLGERNGVLANKRGNEWKKERLTMHVSLCDGGYLLKALGSVAHYLADGIFYSTNDKIIHFCPQEWSNVQEIYRLRRNILERVLRNADQLRWWFNQGELL